MVKDFEILKYGSNKLRNKLNYVPELDMSPGRLMEPIIKGKGYKPRKAQSKEAARPPKKSLEKGKVKREQIQLDKKSY